MQWDSHHSHWHVKGGDKQKIFCPHICQFLPQLSPSINIYHTAPWCWYALHVVWALYLQRITVQTLTALHLKQHQATNPTAARCIIMSSAVCVFTCGDWTRRARLGRRLLWLSMVPTVVRWARQSVCEREGILSASFFAMFMYCVFYVSQNRTKTHDSKYYSFCLFTTRGSISDFENVQ